jgi:hypothetical protein
MGISREFLGFAGLSVMVQAVDALDRRCNAGRTGASLVYVADVEQRSLTRRRGGMDSLAPRPRVNSPIGLRPWQREPMWGGSREHS